MIQVKLQILLSSNNTNIINIVNNTKIIITNTITTNTNMVNIEKVMYIKYISDSKL